MMTTHTYDEFPYFCLIRPDIHPRQLATLAALFGVQTPPVENSQVLELGCGNGINLIAIAQSLPHSKCIGIDYSARQIAEGQKVIEVVKLQNISLRHLDILDFDESFGQFDYIIIHGVYSWVPEPVQEKLLSICQQQLTPQGVAYISYNTYPGWHLNQMGREMLQFFHQQQFGETGRVRPEESKQLVKLAWSLNQANPDAFTKTLEEMWERLQKPDMENYLWHDLLESTNLPMYFYEFVERVKRFGLEYVTDVKFRDFKVAVEKGTTEGEPAVETLWRGDFFAKEQYLDFFLNRKLRMSVLCHQGREINRELDSRVLPNFYLVASPGWQPVTLGSEDNEPFVLQMTNSKQVVILSPLVKQALEYLWRIYPQNVTVAKLLSQILAHPESRPLPHSLDHSSKPPLVEERLAEGLWQLYYREVIELNLSPTPSFITTVNDYPTVSPLARWQAARGEKTVVNRVGQLGRLDEFSCELLPLMDGKHSRQNLLKVMKEWVMKNDLTVTVGEEEVLFRELSNAEVKEILKLYLEEILGVIGRNGLLVDVK